MNLQKAKIMKFELSKKELEDFMIWDKKHKCKHKHKSGSIGGRLTFSFTPTRLGWIVKVNCACGEEIDLSEYEKW